MELERAGGAGARLANRNQDSAPDAGVCADGGIGDGAGHRRECGAVHVGAERAFAAAALCGPGSAGRGLRGAARWGLPGPRCGRGKLLAWWLAEVLGVVRGNLEASPAWPSRSGWITTLRAQGTNCRRWWERRWGRGI